MYLMVEFPRVKSGEREYSIVYYEKVYPFLTTYFATKWKLIQNNPVYFPC